MKTKSGDIKSLCFEGARRILARAKHSHAVKPPELASRIEGAVEKYLLRFEPKTPKTKIETFIDELQADDLCLVVACELGSEEAWGELVSRFTATVRSAARSASSNEDSAEDLVQSIWAELYGLRVAKDGKPASKLAYYSGRGSLAGWLRAVASQLAVDVHRKQSRLVQAEEDSDLDKAAHEMDDSQRQKSSFKSPRNEEQTLVNRFAGVELTNALKEALEKLEPEDRLLVKLYYFDGLRLREAGAILGVHEATASRRLNRIHLEVRQRVTEILMGKHGWTKAEAEASLVEIAENLDADLESFLNEGVS